MQSFRRNLMLHFLVVDLSTLATNNSMLKHVTAGVLFGVLLSSLCVAQEKPKSIEQTIYIQNARSHPVKSGTIQLVNSRDHYHYEKTEVADIQDGRARLRLTPDQVKNVFSTTTEHQRLWLLVQTDHTVYRSEKYDFTAFFRSFPEIFDDLGTVEQTNGTPEISLTLDPLTSRTIQFMNEDGHPEANRDITIGVVHETIGHAGGVHGHRKGTFTTDQNGNMTLRTHGTPRVYLMDPVYKPYDDVLDRAYQHFSTRSNLVTDLLVLDFDRETRVTLRWQEPEEHTYRIRIANPKPDLYDYGLRACKNGHSSPGACGPIMRPNDNKAGLLEGTFSMALHQRYQILVNREDDQGVARTIFKQDLTPGQIRTLTEKGSITVRVQDKSH